MRCWLLRLRQSVRPADTRDVKIALEAVKKSHERNEAAALDVAQTIRQVADDIRTRQELHE